MEMLRNEEVRLYAALDSTNYPNNFHLYLASKKQRIFTLIYAAAVTENSKLDRYLHYRAMLDAKEQGYSWFTLGGMGDSSEKEKSISSYKEKFGGEPMHPNNFRYYANPVVKLLYTAGKRFLKR